MKKVNILCLVDDDDIFQFLTREIIGETRLVDQIKVFSNGLEALNYLKSQIDHPENLPEVILLDLNMPVMDGWEFLDEFMKIQPKLEKKITVFIVSSSISPGDIQKAKSISAVSDYIIKPVTEDRMVELVKSL